MDQERLMHFILRDFEDKNYKIDCKTYSCSLNEFKDALERIDNEKLASGITFKRAKKDNQIKSWILKGATLTVKGRNFLKQKIAVKV